MFTVASFRLTFQELIEYPTDIHSSQVILQLGCHEHHFAKLVISLSQLSI